jgi:hypothetical protein
MYDSASSSENAIKSDFFGVYAAVVASAT